MYNAIAKINEEMQKDPNNRYLEILGQYIIDRCSEKAVASVIWSDGGGWEHVSICPFKRSYMPSWDDMCQLKDMFFKENETVVQYHPAKSEYVNNMANCLHLWRPTNGVLPTPPSIMVGAKQGQSRAEIEAAIKEVCEK